MVAFHSRSTWDGDDTASASFHAVYLDYTCMGIGTVHFPPYIGWGRDFCHTLTWDGDGTSHPFTWGRYFCRRSRTGGGRYGTQ